TDNVKEPPGQLKADSNWFPDLHRGIRLSVQCWRPKLRGGGNRQRRVGGAHLGAALSRVNGFLQFCCAGAKKVRFSLKLHQFSLQRASPEGHFAANPVDFA
ncbi:MAG: hypothetical protein KDE15_07710, partial [Erythrobacter sp.]|nr:hypothetical protein [Erythrobacter sp.]